MSSHIVFDTMGIPVHVTLAGNNTLSWQQGIRDALYAVFDSWDARFSRFRLDSELHYINEHSGSPIAVSKEMFAVLARCKELSHETDGVFDASVGAYLAAAGYGLPNHYVLPKKVPTYKDMVLDEVMCRVTCAAEQVLEPAGIVKGMAIDAAGEVLAGIEGWMINAGGDILTHGVLSAQDHEWRVGIQHPQIPSALVTVVGIHNEAIATSGTYAVVFKEAQGGVSHHQVSMHEGMSTTEVMSVTVIASNAQKADEYASIGILLGRDRGMTYLEKHHVPYLCIGTDGIARKNALWIQRERPW